MDNIVDNYDELLDGLFVEMYFENLGGGYDYEVVVPGDEKTCLEANVYKL